MDGANDVKHVETMLMTSTEGSGYRRQYITTHVALNQHSGDAEPLHTYITAGTTTVRPIEGTKLVEVTDNHDLRLPINGAFVDPSLRLSVNLCGVERLFDFEGLLRSLDKFGQDGCPTP